MDPYAPSFVPSHAPSQRQQRTLQQTHLNPFAPSYNPAQVPDTGIQGEGQCEKERMVESARGSLNNPFSYIYDDEDVSEGEILSNLGNENSFLPKPMPFHPSMFRLTNRKRRLFDLEELREELEMAWAKLDLHIDGARKLHEEKTNLNEMIASLRTELSWEQKAHTKLDLEKTQIALERERYREERLKSKRLEEKCSRLEIQLASERGASRREQVKNRQILSSLAEMKAKVISMTGVSDAPNEN